MNVFKGGCHCGAVAVEFKTEKAADELQVRACGCSFCRKHASRNASDREGALTIFADRGALQVYRFGAGVTDFLVCKSCGVYVAAAMEAGGEFFATVNLNVLDGGAFAGREPQPVSYDAETGDDKIARRLKVWTPTRFAPRAEAP